MAEAMGWPSIRALHQAIAGGISQRDFMRRVLLETLNLTGSHVGRIEGPECEALNSSQSNLSRVAYPWTTLASLEHPSVSLGLPVEKDGQPFHTFGGIADVRFRTESRGEVSILDVALCFQEMPVALIRLGKCQAHFDLNACQQWRPFFESVADLSAWYFSGSKNSLPAKLPNVEFSAELTDASAPSLLTSIEVSLFRKVFDSAAIGMALISPSGHYSRVNAVWCEITGYSPDMLLGRSWLELAPERDEAESLAILERLCHGTLTDYTLETPYIRPDGTQTWVVVTASAVSTGQPGASCAILLQLKEIMAQKQAEQALQDSERRFRSAFDWAAIGMGLLSPEGQWLRINQALIQITGYDAETLARLSYRDITHPEDWIYDQTFMEQVRRGEIQTYHLEKRFVRADSTPIWIQLNVSSVRTDGGELAYFIIQVQDIEDRKQAESQLRMAKEAAEHAAAIKAEFLATISHEIRTPMNAVLGMATVLAETPLDAEQCDLVATIQSGSSTLLDIMNDILDFSKIESGKMELVNHPMEIRACIEDCFALFSREAARKGVDLRFELAEDVPLLVWGDATRLRQILVNLVGNAVKFTDAGWIDVTVRAMPSADDCQDSPDMRTLLVRVKDTGCGIAQDKFRIIFESFTQVAPAISGKYGGTGLGLAICNRLVQLMGGRIWVESEPGKGATFCFSWPTRAVPVSPVLVPSPELAMSRSDWAQRYPLKILVAEDNATNQKLILHILRQMGYAPTLVENGQAVLGLLEKERYELVFLDIQMPEMDGLQVARQVTERYPPEQRPRLIAMTAYGMTGDRQKGLAAGMDDYLCKPFTSELVQSLLRRWHGWLHGALPSLDLPLLDWSAIQSQWAEQPERWAEMKTAFSDDVARLLEASRQAVLPLAPDALSRHLHELKGACMALPAPRLKQLALLLENAVAQSDWSQVAFLLETFELEFEKAGIELLQPLPASPLPV